MKIHIDFIKDIKAIMRKEMLDFGFKKADIDDEKIPFQYINFQRRLIEQKNWDIFYSKEFNCPNEYKVGLQLLLDKIEKGFDITPHLSRRIKWANFDDDLLNEWNIYHLHLGTNLEDDGFIERTKYVLYLYKDKNQLYLIDILDHQNFNNQNLVTIIHNNWPQLIEGYLLKEAVRLERPITNDDIKQMRKAHVLAFIEPVPGKVYMPMGMGNTTSGLGIEVVRQADAFMSYFKGLERVALDLLNQLISKSVNLKARREIFARLDVEGDIPYVEVTNIPGIKIRLVK